MKSRERIRWVDIYKAIAIILVVVGHSTARFNPYIYQFHMAAFFFISGYTTDFKKRNIYETVRDRFRTLLLPFFIVFFLMISGEWMLEHLGIRDCFFAPEFVYGGAPQSIIRLILYGENYAWFLSACWFLTVMFGIEVLHKLMDCLCAGRKTVYMLMSAALFVCGYLIIKLHGGIRISIFDVDLVCIGQLYFGIGKIVHDLDILEKIRSRQIILFFLGCLNAWLLYWFTYKCPVMVCVDYPSRIFNFPVADAAAALNGICLLFVAASVIERLRYISPLLIMIGRNTLGIVFFHFMFFKAGYLILYFIGEVPFSYMQNFIPTAEIGNKWWVLMVTVSISLSIICWNILLTIKTCLKRRFFRTAAADA